MALNNFYIGSTSENISGGEHKIKRALSNVTASVAQEKTDVKTFENGQRNELLRSSSAG